MRHTGLLPEIGDRLIGLGLDGFADAADHPNIAGLAPVIAAHSDMSTFESALDLLLGSFARQLRETPA